MALEEAADTLRESMRILKALEEPDLLARPLSGADLHAAGARRIINRL